MIAVFYNHLDFLNLFLTTFLLAVGRIFGIDDNLGCIVR